MSWVSSNTKMIAVNGDRVTPPRAPARPRRAQTPGVVPGRTWPMDPTERGARRRIGARSPRSFPKPSTTGPNHQLHHEQQRAGPLTPSWPSSSAWMVS